MRRTTIAAVFVLLAIVSISISAIVFSFLTRPSVKKNTQSASTTETVSPSLQPQSFSALGADKKRLELVNQRLSAGTKKLLDLYGRYNSFIRLSQFQILFRGLFVSLTENELKLAAPESRESLVIVVSNPPGLPLFLSSEDKPEGKKVTKIGKSDIQEGDTVEVLAIVDPQTGIVRLESVTRTRQ